MKEIVDKLNENHQIQLAKEILEAHGYKVSKKKDSFYIGWAQMTVDELADYLEKHPALKIIARGDSYYLASGPKDSYAHEVESDMIDILRKDPRFEYKFISE